MELLHLTGWRSAQADCLGAALLGGATCLAPMSTVGPFLTPVLFPFKHAVLRLIHSVPFEPRESIGCPTPAAAPSGSWTWSDLLMTSNSFVACRLGRELVGPWERTVQTARAQSGSRGHSPTEMAQMRLMRRLFLAAYLLRASTALFVTS